MSKRYTLEAHCIRCWEPLIGRLSKVPANAWLALACGAPTELPECPNKCPPLPHEPHLRFALVWYEERESRRVLVTDHQDKKRTRAK